MTGEGKATKNLTGLTYKSPKPQVLLKAVSSSFSLAFKTFILKVKRAGNLIKAKLAQHPFCGEAFCLQSSPKPFVGSALDLYFLDKDENGNLSSMKAITSTFYQCFPLEKSHRL